MKTGNIEQMLKEFSDGTYDLTDNGKCTQCGKCCSNILPMTEDEISVIRRFVKKHYIKEHKHILPLAEPTIDMTCPFLDDSKSCEKCTIYEVRPRICRDFICCPSKRPPMNDLKYKLKCRIVDVRSEFFGKD